MTSPVQTPSTAAHDLAPLDSFVRRHLGSDDTDIAAMLKFLDCDDLEALVSQAIPDAIRSADELQVGPQRGEAELLAELRAISKQNVVQRSFIGCGYYGTRTPALLLRNILENPGWYTQYTPYQAEISQGRLEALLNFQTMIADLTGLPLANASLLDEATACAEAMTMCWSIGKAKRTRFFVASDCHPQTIAVMQTRAKPVGIELIVGELSEFDPSGDDFMGVLLQYPTSDGRVEDYAAFCESAHAHSTLVVAATDLLALTLLKAPGEWGADIAVGSSQRFGVPMGFGGPHAGFMSTSEAYKRQIPGRIIGVSKDSHGAPAYRLAMQTREQHIRRDKATSNICTAQVLLAIMAGMYATYHGPQGLRDIAERVHTLTRRLSEGLNKLGHGQGNAAFFDTLRVMPQAGSRDSISARLAEARFELRSFDDGSFGISVDETSTPEDIATLLSCFGATDLSASIPSGDLLAAHRRQDDFLSNPVFHQYHTEHEMLRYLNRLQAKDLSLTTSMIPLGSCTMKLNATSEMLPITWPEFSDMHPFTDPKNAKGYAQLFESLEAWLCDITGFAAMSLQPNAGSQGEYAGLLAIRGYHEARGDFDRDVCIIPVSAHGTNPASAVMAGFRVIAVKCDDLGNIDVDDLRAKAIEHRERLGALMITYPSTHGVFEATVREVCSIIHEHGGQVYMDGANMNAQVGLCRPGEMGADVCHLNLHKTFAIPHGGGGPGVGPIGVAAHLRDYLPGHPFWSEDSAVGPVAAAPYGSAGVLPISWMYVALLGSAGLRKCSQLAILNANYMAHRLSAHYDILYTGESGRVAHEFILDVRPFKNSANATVDDFAKRLMDYGFHAPTMSWPVAGTLMVEPTESESRAELDRFCDAMIGIREEIRAIEEDRADRDDNVLRNAPHTMHECTRDDWTHPYTRQDAGFPAPWTKAHKFWPSVGRVDNAYGDRNLVCTCPSVEEMAE